MVRIDAVRFCMRLYMRPTLIIRIGTLDTLARVSAYLLSEPSASFAPLLKPLLTPQSVPETLVVILLDWSDPWTWTRRLREWVRLLRHVLISLDDETKVVMEETMTEWRDRKRGLDASASAGAGGLASSGGPVTIPLGPGEWDEGLGIPICVVCQGVCGFGYEHIVRKVRHANLWAGR